MEGKLKNIILFSVIGVAMAGVYMFFVRGDSDQDILVATPGTPVLPNDTMSIPSGSAAAEFLPILLNVKNIRLENSIFNDPAFMSLRDSSILLIPDGTEGRPNPFAPIGFENLAVPIAPTTGTPPSAVPGASN
jgi:hypothetical protein